MRIVLYYTILFCSRPLQIEGKEHKEHKEPRRTQRCALYGLLCSLCSLFLLQNYCIAQPNENQFRLLTKENGLSDNRITGIVQDEKGFLWVSTLNGLNRFDGTHFTIFKDNSSDGAIPGNAITTIHYFGKGYLGIATEGGAQLINTSHQLQRTNLLVPTDTLLHYWSNHVMDISKTADGHFVVSTKTGLFAFDGNGKLLQRHDRYTVQDAGKAWMIYGAINNTLPDSSVLAQVEDGFMQYDPASNKFTPITASPAGTGKLMTDYKKSTIFFQLLHDSHFLYTDTETNELIVFNYKTNSKFRLPLPFRVVEQIGWPSRVSQLSDSTFAITGFYKGFFILTRHRQTNTYSLSPKYFANYSCTYVFADKDNRLWIGAREGLFMQKITTKQVETFYINKPEPSSKTYTIADVIAWKNNLYAAELNSSDIVVLDKQSMKPKQVIKLSKEIGFTYSFLQVHPDTLWIGTNRGLRWLHPLSGRFGKIDNPTYPAALDSMGILRWMQDSRGNYWFETNGMMNTILFYNPETETFRLVNMDQSDPLFKINKPFGIAEDIKGHIWISGDGLCRLNSKTFQCDTLIKRFQDFNPFRPAMVALNTGNDPSIWIKSSNNGLLQWDPYTQKQTIFTNRNGLYDNIVRYIISAGHYIAMLHTDGLSIFDITTHSSQNYFPGDGLGNPLSYYFLRYDASEQFLYAMGSNVISRIQLTADAAIKDPSPPLVITALRIGNDTLIHYPADKIKLTHHQNDISIVFTAIHFGAAANLRYAYSVSNGPHSEWIDLGNQSVVNFNNLQPGHYTFYVKAYSANNEWKEVVQPVDIYIAAPWWRQLWFKLLAGAVAIALLILAYRKRIAQIRQEGELNQRLAGYEMKALYAQMNPHFIFNCLNSIKFMILQKDTTNASLYLTKFSRMIRQTLEQSQQGLVSILKETEYLADYLDMEKLRFDHSFQYEIRVDSALHAESTLIPTMLLQPIAENAVWHGLMHKAGEKKITILFYKEADKIICRIEDNGVGFDNKSNGDRANHQSTGISNIQKRIRLLNQKYRMSSAIYIENNAADTGTCIKLVLDNVSLSTNEML